jgi:hypothetical protein
MAAVAAATETHTLPPSRNQSIHRQQRQHILRNTPTILRSNMQIHTAANSRRNLWCRCQLRRRQVRIHGIIITTNRPPLTPHSRNHKIATSARHATRPSQDQAVYGFIVTVIRERSHSNVLITAVARLSACVVT